MALKFRSFLAHAYCPRVRSRVAEDAFGGVPPSGGATIGTGS